jgi:hypothetical protein
LLRAPSIVTVALLREAIDPVVHDGLSPKRDQERKHLKERLMALDEEALLRTLVAAAVRLRGDDIDLDWGWDGPGSRSS